MDKWMCVLVQCCGKDLYTVPMDYGVLEFLIKVTEAPKLCDQVIKKVCSSGICTLEIGSFSFSDVPTKPSPPHSNVFLHNQRTEASRETHISEHFTGVVCSRLAL